MIESITDNLSFDKLADLPRVYPGTVGECGAACHCERPKELVLSPALSKVEGEAEGSEAISYFADEIASSQSLS